MHDPPVRIFACAVDGDRGRKHLQQSIENPIPDGEVAIAFGERYEGLHRECRTDRGFFAWAAPERHGRFIRDLNRGDVVLFAVGQAYRYITRALCAPVREPRAAAFWDPSSHDRAGPYSHVFFVSTPENIAAQIPGVPTTRPGIFAIPLSVVDAAQVDSVLGGWFGRGLPTLEPPIDAARAVAQARRDAMSVADERAQQASRMEQALLREIVLAGQQQGQCALCGQHVPADLLWVAHIKPRSKCSASERKDLRNLMLACKLGCDDLFELGYIIVVGGCVQRSPSAANRVTPAVAAVVDAVDGKRCLGWYPEQEPFFEWHRAYAA